MPDPQELLTGLVDGLTATLGGEEKQASPGDKPDENVKGKEEGKEEIKDDAKGQGDTNVKEVKEEPKEENNKEKVKGDDVEPSKTPSVEQVNTSEMFGEQFQSIDDVKKVLDDYEITRRDLESKDVVISELKEKLSKSYNPFANDVIGKFNAFVKETGIDNYDLFKQLSNSEIEKLSDVDKIVLSRLVDNPDLYSRRAALKKAIENQYRVAEINDPDSEEDKDILEMNLIEAASSATRKLGDMSNKIKSINPVAEPEPSEESEKIENLKKTLSPLVPEMEKRVRLIPIVMEGDKDPIYNFELDQSQRKEFSESFVNYLISNRMELNDNNAKTAYAAASGIFIAKNIDKIMKGVHDKIHGDLEKQFLEKYSGGKVPKSDKKVEEKDKSEGSVDSVFEKISSRLRG